jgi:hypothetical protein
MSSLSPLSSLSSLSSLSNIDQIDLLEFKKFVTIYLSNNNDLKDLNKSQLYLKQYRNKQVNGFNIKDSRTLYMSVLLYRFKTELDVGEIFWKITRIMILSILTNNQTIDLNIKNYLDHFEIWKKNDIDKLIIDIASVYFNVLETKLSIENDKTNTDKTNIVQLDNILKNIEEQCIKINILEQVLCTTHSIIDSKNKHIMNIVTKAYWDKIEEDIENHNYTIIIANLEELKNNMKQILPKTEINNLNYLLDECFDISYFKEMMTNNVFDKSNISNLLNIIMVFLKEWDSLDVKEIYDTEYNRLNDLINNSEYHTGFRILLENCSELVSNLLMKKEAWIQLLLKK